MDTRTGWRLAGIYGYSALHIAAWYVYLSAKQTAAWLTLFNLLFFVLFADELTLLIIKHQLEFLTKLLCGSQTRLVGSGGRRSSRQLARAVVRGLVEVPLFTPWTPTLFDKHVLRVAV